MLLCSCRDNHRGSLDRQASTMVREDRDHVIGWIGRPKIFGPAPWTLAIGWDFPPGTWPNKPHSARALAWTARVGLPVCLTPLLPAASCLPGIP